MYALYKHADIWLLKLFVQGHPQTAKVPYLADFGQK